METPKFTFLFAVVLFAGLIAAAAGNQQPRSVGGYKPILNLIDTHLVEIGKFAVAEHNKNIGASLEFRSLDAVESKVVAGTNYRLVLTARSGGDAAKYGALVYEKPWKKSLSLTSFERIQGAN